MSNEPVVIVPLLVIFAALPVVSASEVIFKAFPKVVLTLVRLSSVPVPVVDEPMMSTKLPVKPVETPDCVTLRALCVVCETLDEVMVTVSARAD